MRPVFLMDVLNTYLQDVFIISTHAVELINTYKHCNLGMMGAITGAITTPLDVLKTRLMTQGSIKHYSGLLSCTHTIIKEEGVAALWKGIGPRILWIGLGGSIFFGVLEKTKALLAHQNSSIDLKSDSLKQ